MHNSYYYKHQEIVCEHHLEHVDEDYYAYRGAPIPFDPLGVWPMRDEPTVNDMEPHSNCYTESKAFHLTYRALLYKLQEVFNGHPEKVPDAVQLMEALQVHGKRLVDSFSSK